jgi:DMSO/TMAO reductase YedYZ molybdopterin-dependent catalytic subunit
VASVTPRDDNSDDDDSGRSRSGRPRSGDPDSGSPRSGGPRSGSSAGRGIVAGLLAAFLALAVAQLVAGLISSASSPVVAVGQLSIDLTPPAVKDFAINAFGSHDKTVLVGGILVILAALAAVIGVAAVRRLSYGMIGLGLFVLIGVVASVTRPDSSAGDALPTILGGIAAAIALRRLVAAVPHPPPPAVTRPPAPAARPAARPAPPPAQPRRSFITTSAVVAGTALVAGAGGRLLGERGSVATARRSLRIPAPARPAPPVPDGANLNIRGLSPFITPNSQFYRVDTAIVLPEIPPASWRLRLHGMVEKELTLTFDDLIKRPLIEDYVTLTCVSNPVAGPYVGNAKWLGASLGSLLREAGIRPGASQLLCTSTDGFTSGTPASVVMDGRDAMLAVAMNGAVLPVEHGFPVRMVVPGLYGYVSACKWITDIEVTTFADAHAYWTVRGWSQQAPIKTESRIDVPGGNGQIAAGALQVAGVAWAQHKGIEAVEVRVDRGPWREARLAGVPGLDCWRQWAWTWQATPGNHMIESRATDKTGYTQTALQAPPAPNGASGYPQAFVRVN